MDGSVGLCEEEEGFCRVSTSVVERIPISFAVFSAVHHKEDDAITPGCCAAVAISVVFRSRRLWKLA